MENVRKRSQKEIADARTYAVEKFAGDLLSVSDNLARALAALPNEERETAGDNFRRPMRPLSATETPFDDDVDPVRN